MTASLVKDKSCPDNILKFHFFLFGLVFDMLLSFFLLKFEKTLITGIRLEVQVSLGNFNPPGFLYLGVTIDNSFFRQNKRSIEDFLIVTRKADTPPNTYLLPQIPQSMVRLAQRLFRFLSFGYGQPILGNRLVLSQFPQMQKSFQSKSKCLNERISNSFE